MGLLRKDWFAGLAISLAIIFLGNLGTFDGIERSAYDYGVRYSSKIPSDKIAIIAIDDISIANIGRWPWPRDIQAEMHRILGQSGVKIIGQTTLFVDPQLDPGLSHIQQLLGFYGGSSLSTNLHGISKQLPTQSKNLENDLIKLGELLLLAEQQLNTDQVLAQSLEENKNIILAMHFALGEPQGKPDSETPAYIKQNLLTNIHNDPLKNPDSYYPLPAIHALFPIPEIGPLANSIAALNAYPDDDGAIRSSRAVRSRRG
ncbi:MAG: CHASE2 domain-containing protein [Gammaproteobacteria bacterium]|nr:CHASE2 domain-containing protein [Gammaproteobacteria bacterium]